MSWNHRVVKDRHGYHTIREVYYNADGTVDHWTIDPMHPFGATIPELEAELARFVRAVREPVLVEEDMLAVTRGATE